MTTDPQPPADERPPEPPETDTREPVPFYLAADDDDVTAGVFGGPQVLVDADLKREEKE